VRRLFIKSGNAAFHSNRCGSGIQLIPAVGLSTYNLKFIPPVGGNSG